jgi:lipoyl(octanoyl) transferase
MGGDEAREPSLETLRAARMTAEQAFALPLHAYWFGRVPYAYSLHAMRDYSEQRDEHAPDQFWLLEHDPVFTLGQAGKAEHVLAAGDIEVIQVERGGQVTYHGPGQLVLYPLLDLRRLKLGVRALVDALEHATVACLQSFGIQAQADPKAPGVYVEGRKIMALGLRVRRGMSFHGMALNVNMDLSPYQRINPCGYQGLQITDIAREGGPAELQVVATHLVSSLANALGLPAPPLAQSSLPAPA